MKEKISRKYCELCGREMKFSTYLSGYDSYTGEPVYYTKTRCPFFFGIHQTGRTYDEQGWEVYERYY